MRKESMSITCTCATFPVQWQLYIVSTTSVLFVMSITGTTYSVQWQIYIVSTTRVLSCQLLVPLIQFKGRYTLSAQPEFFHVNYWYHLFSSMADIHSQYNQNFVMSITGTTYSVQWQIYIVSTTRILSCQLLVPPIIQFNGRYTL